MNAWNRGFIALACVCAALSGCTKKPDIKFAPHAESYASKTDFAEVEHAYPLTPKQRDALTPENLASFSQEELDQIYARLTAGPVPDGEFSGTFFFADGGGVKRISEVLGGLKGVAVDIKLKKMERLGEALWKGKVFYKDRKILRNMIRDRDYLKLIIDGDPDTLPKTKINGVDTWLLFPAKLYCGQSLLDARRESLDALARLHLDLDQHQIAFDVIARTDIIDPHHGDDLLELLADLFEHAVVADDDERHPRELGVFGFADGQAIDVEAAGGEHAGHVGQHAGHVLHRGRKDVSHSEKLQGGGILDNIRATHDPQRAEFSSRTRRGPDWLPLK
jgi:hypothetical protein